MLSSTLMTAATLAATTTTTTALTASIAATFKARLRRTLVTISRVIGCWWWWCLPRGRILILYRHWMRLAPAVPWIAAVGLSNGWLLPARTAVAAWIRVVVVTRTGVAIIVMAAVVVAVVALIITAAVAPVIMATVSAIIAPVVTAMVIGPVTIVIIAAAVPARIAAVRPARVINNDRRSIIRMVVGVENSEAEERNNWHVRIKRDYWIRPVNVNRGVVVNNFGLLANNHSRLRLDDDRLRFALNRVRLVVIGCRGDRVIAGHMRWRHGVATGSVTNQHDKTPIQRLPAAAGGHYIHRISARMQAAG